jgi:DNA-directed RNA polymerase specialized sigma24 family protein
MSNSDTPARVPGKRYPEDVVQETGMRIISARDMRFLLFPALTNTQYSVIMLKFRGLTYKEIHKIHKAITIRTMKRWVQDIKRRYPEIEKFF